MFQLRVFMCVCVQMRILVVAKNINHKGGGCDTASTEPWITVLCGAPAPLCQCKHLEFNNKLSVDVCSSDLGQFIIAV